MHILDKIVKTKKQEIIDRKAIVSIDELEKKISDADFEPHPFAAAINNSPTGIISEFKRRSPSRPDINIHAKSKEIVPGYADSGAAAISILTDQDYFGGSLQDIYDTRSLMNKPILRKEFIIDEYQIYESAAVGANAILLIAEILSKAQIESFCRTAHRLNMETLLELHSESELTKINEFLDVIGINNRNLKTFKTDINYSITLYDKLPKEVVKISESGLKNVKDLKTLMNIGYDGFLIGERFMNTSDPAKSLKDFIETLMASDEN